MKTPHYWVEKATEAEKAGRWKEAAGYWFKAKGAAIGHKRRERYEDREQACLDRAV